MSRMTVVLSRQVVERKEVSNVNVSLTAVPCLPKIKVLFEKTGLWSHMCYNVRQFHQSYGSIWCTQNFRHEFCNITDFAHRNQCKIKWTWKKFKQKNSFGSNIKIEEKGVNNKFVSSTTRSGKSGKTRNMSCSFNDILFDKHTL